MVDFGDKLRLLRTARNMSQEQLAGRLSVTKSMISAYENSVRLPSYGVLTKIALFFNVSIDYLFGFADRRFLDTTDLSEDQFVILARLVDELKSSK